MDCSSSPKSLSTFGRLKQMVSPKWKEEKVERRTESRTIQIANSAALVDPTSPNYKQSSSTSMRTKTENYRRQSLISCVKTVGGDLSIEEAESAVKSSDLNGDGLLDFHEFHMLMETSSGSEEEKKTELKQAFGIYDMEECGVITAEGLKRMLSRLGELRTINDCKAMIRAFDLNDDGVLSFDEFLVMMR